MLKSLGERIALAPASARIAHHSCYPGGFVVHSMNVLRNLLKLNSSFGADLNKNNIVITAMFHDLGKVGDLKEDYYLVNDISWQVEKGELYKINDSLLYMTVPQRSLWLLSQFDVKLTQDETLAILLHDGMYAEENKKYANKETALTLLLHIADNIASKQEKGLF
jgi:hypothetical protein